MDNDLMKQIDAALPIGSHVTKQQAYDCLHGLARRCVESHQAHRITGDCGDDYLPIPRRLLAGLPLREMCSVINAAVNNTAGTQPEKVFLLESYGCDCSLVVPEFARAR